MYDLSKNAKQNFPLCCLGLNISLFILQLLRERRICKVCNKYDRLDEGLNIV